MPVQTDQLLGAPEWRGIDDYEVRKSSDGNEFIVRGYASLFANEYPVMGGPEAGGFNERVDRGAFDKTLAANPDVHFLINHTGVTLARTKSGTLKLSTDSTGLLSEARIDRRTSDGRDLEIRMERGDLDEMSFAFRTVRHSFTDDGELRTLLEVNIDKGDVSVVNNGANDKTRIRIADAVRAFTTLELAEVRSMENPLASLTEARAHLDDLIREVTPKDSRRLSLAEAVRVIEGRD
jgi:HK97 family phage prohead protease